MELTTQQKKKLKAIAHGLHPVVTIGQQGIKETIHEEIDNALNHHQLLKVKIIGEKQEREKLSTAIAKKHHSNIIQSIGRIVVFYRRNKDKNDILKS
jgi:RNA-binding protein